MVASKKTAKKTATKKPEAEKKEEVIETPEIENELPDTPEAEEADDSKPENVTFVWVIRSQKRKIVMRDSGIIYTPNGIVPDPQKPGKRLLVENGSFTTSDPEEIEFLKSHPDFGTMSNKGFDVMRGMTLEQELKSIQTKHNLSDTDLAKLMKK